MFRKLAAESELHEVLSVMLQLWLGVLLIYTFGMNPLLGFFVSAVLWRLTKFEGKQKLNMKKLSLIALLIAVSEYYKASEFVLNAVIGFTVFQVLSLFSKSKCETLQSGLPMVYVSMAIYYTLRMTLVFSVPEILMPIHEGYMSAGKFLSEKAIGTMFNLAIKIFVVAFIATLSVNILTGLVDNARETATSSDFIGNISYFLQILLYALILFYMTKKIPELVSGLGVVGKLKVNNRSSE